MAVIVYDVANRQSFLNVAKWIDEVKQERGENVVIAIVGYKTDLVEEREVETEVEVEAGLQIKMETETGVEKRVGIEVELGIRVWSEIVI